LVALWTVSVGDREDMMRSAIGDSDFAGAQVPHRGITILDLPTYTKQCEIPVVFDALRALTRFACIALNDLLQPSRYCKSSLQLSTTHALDRIEKRG
jgi:hypothetical protein